jgi:enoyl-CoA hydratase/carnithine racemase
MQSIQTERGRFTLLTQAAGLRACCIATDARPVSEWCRGTALAAPGLLQASRPSAYEGGEPAPGVYHMSETVAGPSALRLAKEDGIAFLVADNPARMNAFTGAMWQELPRALADAEADPAVRVIVLRGAGSRAFSAGADISEFATQRTGEAARTYDRWNHAAFAALKGARKPTIAMIHGHCLGGGLGLALCCDLRLADDKAQFAIPAAKLGIGYNPRWIEPLLQVVPPPAAKELLFTGRRFSAAEAASMGLVSRVVPADSLEQTTRNLAAEIAANAPLTIAAAKRAIDELSRRTGTPDVAALEKLVEACFESADYAEGRTAFMEKRPPRFVGK